MKKNKSIKKLETNFLQCVPWEQVKERWGKIEFNRFMKWMRGQTCVEEGVYICDIISYANQRNKGM